MVDGDREPIHGIIMNNDLPPASHDIDEKLTIYFASCLHGLTNVWDSPA